MKRYTVLQFALLLLAGGVLVWLGFNWLRRVPEVALDGDEVVWVLDAQLYKHRVDGQIAAFTPPKDVRMISWNHPSYRVVDQPQTGKYIFGFLFDMFAIEPWDEERTQKLYVAFATRKLPVAPPHELNNELGSDMVRAIIAARYSSATVALMVFFLFGWLLYHFSKNWLVSLGAPLLVFLHPTTRHFYRLAITNTYAAFFQLLTIGLLLQAFTTKMTGRSSKIYWLVAGLCAALATSIKLHGAFLVLLPVVLFIAKQYDHGLRHVAQKEALLFLKSYGLFIVSFAAMFFFLEPELWTQPLQGVRSLFGARLYQQQKFLRAFDNLSMPHTGLFLVTQYLRLAPNLLVSITIMLSTFVGVVALFKSSLTQTKYRVWSSAFLFFFLTNIYYARVGFERYAMPSLFVLSITTMVGFQDILMYLKKYSKKTQIAPAPLKSFSVIIFLCVATTVFTGCVTTKSEPQVIEQEPAAFRDRQKIKLTVGDAAPIEVEIVNTPASIAQGLSGRDEIGADGMLFIFDKTDKHTFWMKEMKFNLDFVWIRDNKVVDLTKDVPAPAPNTPVTKLLTYSAKEPVDSVLELDAGKIEKLGIDIGDTLAFMQP